MRITNSRNRIAFRILTLVIVIAFLGSCSGAGENLNISKAVARNIIETKSKFVDDMHYSKGEKSFSETVVSSGFIELRLDRDTNTFAVYNTAKESLWSVLPLLENLTQKEERQTNASAVTLRVIGGTDVYILNSQDNSVAYGTSKTETSSGGAVFTYNIFADENTAAKTTYENTDIGFEVKLAVTLADGNMRVSCNWKNITGNKSAYIESIDLLNYFGAYNDTSEGDFILVPDGCGAVIKTSVFDESFEALSFNVYGNDAAAPSESSGCATIPAFGIKHGKCAYAALIEKGDAAATINADKAINISDYNRAYASFSITPSSYTDEKLFVSAKETTSELQLCYRFLSGNNATYAGMASAIREQLIRNSVISTRNIQPTDYLPFFVTLNGIAVKAIGPVRYSSVLTDFDQATDMLVRMKNKGINNACVRFASALQHGGNQSDIKHADVLWRLGGYKGLEKLNNYVSGQKMSLFLDVDIVSSAGKIKNSAYDIEGERINSSFSSLISDELGVTLKNRKLRNLRHFRDDIKDILAFVRNSPLTGICINDAGRMLYSDFSDEGLLRQDASEAIAEAIVPLSTGKEIMVSTGNFYLLKSVDSVIDIPLTTTVSKSGAYTPVPFIQLVLHGILDYAGEPINLYTSEREAKLRSVEYGACPHYEWNYVPYDGNGENDRFYYDNTINSAADFYSRANDALNDLRDARMADHYEVSDGVFCTEYDNGAMVYVNYTDRDYTTLGVVVEAENFLRVN